MSVHSYCTNIAFLFIFYNFNTKSIEKQELCSKWMFRPHLVIVKKKFKKLWTKKNCQIKPNFTSKNPFVILNIQSKIIDKNQRGVAKSIFWHIFKHPLWFLFVTFFMEDQNYKRILEVTLAWFDNFSLFKVFQKNYFTMLKWGLNFYFEHNSYTNYIKLIMNLKLSSSSYPISFAMTNNGFLYVKDLSTLWFHQVPMK